MRKEPENICLSAHACTLRHDLPLDMIYICFNFVLGQTTCHEAIFFLYSTTTKVAEKSREVIVLPKHPLSNHFNPNTLKKSTKLIVNSEKPEHHLKKPKSTCRSLFLWVFRDKNKHLQTPFIEWNPLTPKLIFLWPKSVLTNYFLSPQPASNNFLSLL